MVQKAAKIKKITNAKESKIIANYGINIDEDTLKQFEDCHKEPYVEHAALMPDAHKGYAAPIGSVLITRDYIVPAWVGFDIGCGMTAAHLKGKTLIKQIKEKTEEIYESVKKEVPMGMGELNTRERMSEETQEAYKKLLKDFQKKPYDKNILNFLQGKAIRHLGSLGDGNHFIELAEGDEGEAWIVVHSGSRGVGYKVAERYMKKSAGNNEQYEATHPIHKDSETGKEYLNILDFGLEFALLNRLEIIKGTIKGIENVLGKKIKWELWTNKNHNHAIKERDGTFVHRKGATPAKRGERGVIPGNMRDGSFLVEGKGSSAYLKSSSLGAGRILSRKQAREDITLDAFKESMKGIKGTVTEGTIDESPMAYKNVFDVMKAQEKSVKIVNHLKPIINWKGEKGRRGKGKNK